MFKREAINEYIHNLNAPVTKFTGPLQCFCQQQKKQDHPNDEIYTLLDANKQPVYQGPICDEYFRDIIISKLLGISIGFIIVGVNVVLKKVIIKLVKWIGYDTYSD